MRFEQRARDYARHARPQAEVVRRLASRIPAADTPIETLELGAGTGLLTRALVRLGYRVFATDLAEAMVAAGGEAVPTARWGRLDAWHPPLACCDRLFSSSLLQWCPDPEATFRRYRESLRPGGLMTHAVFVEGTLAELNTFAEIPSPVRWRPDSLWAEAVRDAGFTITDEESIRFATTHRSALDLFREIHGTGAVSGKATLGPAEFRRVIRDYDRCFAAPEGGVSATWCAYLFTARRD